MKMKTVDIQLYMGLDIIPEDGAMIPSFSNENKDLFGIQFDLDVPVGFPYVLCISSSQLVGWEKRKNFWNFPGTLEVLLGEGISTEEGIVWYFPEISGEAFFSPKGGKTHALYPDKGLILLGSQFEKDKYTAELSEKWQLSRIESEASSSLYLSITERELLLAEKRVPSTTRATQLWLCSLPRLTGSVLDQNFAGKFARIPVSDVDLFYRVPTIRELLPVTLRMKNSYGELVQEKYLAYRNSSAWLGKLMDIGWNTNVALVDESSANNRGKVMYAEQFEKTHHTVVESLLTNNLVKVGGKKVDWMFAWTHFSNIADGEIGMAEAVAVSIIQQLVKSKEGKAHKETILQGLKDFGPGILNGVRTYGVRQPVSAPGGAVIMPIRVVSSLAPIVGVTLQTAKAMGGDFDHDLFFGGFTSSEKESAAGQASAIAKILENILDGEIISSILEGGN